jgi:predicted transcriptional regulator
VTQVGPDCQRHFRFIFLELAVPVSVEICVVNCATIFRGMKQRKGELIKARVSSKMKRGINDLADQRGESEAVIVREALSQYLTSNKNVTDKIGRRSLAMEAQKGRRRTRT